MTFFLTTTVGNVSETKDVQSIHIDSVYETSQYSDFRLAPSRLHVIDILVENKCVGDM
jgi:hypothetical protein